MRNFLIGLCLLVVPFLSHSLELSATVECSDTQIKQFENFLAGNKTAFELKRTELYSEADPCSNITYIKLVEAIDEVSADATKKGDMCATAASFCKEESEISEKPYKELQTILVPDCSKGTRFVISKRECTEYFN